MNNLVEISKKEEEWNGQPPSPLSIFFINAYRVICIFHTCFCTICLILYLFNQYSLIIEAKILVKLNAGPEGGVLITVFSMDSN